MPSTALILAARANGKKSRGPKTASGKAASAANSRKHGVFAKTLETDAACEAEYRERLASFSAETRIPSPEEDHLIRTIALAIAREHWAIRKANTIIEHELKTHTSVYDAFAAHWAAMDVLANLESRCFRSWYRATERLQSLRDSQKNIFPGNEPNSAPLQKPGNEPNPDSAFRQAGHSALLGVPVEPLLSSDSE